MMYKKLLFTIAAITSSNLTFTDFFSDVAQNVGQSIGQAVQVVTQQQAEAWRQQVMQSTASPFGQLPPQIFSIPEMNPQQKLKSALDAVNLLHQSPSDLQQILGPQVQVIINNIYAALQKASAVSSNPQAFIATVIQRPGGLFMNLTDLYKALSGLKSKFQPGSFYFQPFNALYNKIEPFANLIYSTPATYEQSAPLAQQLKDTIMQNTPVAYVTKPMTNPAAQQGKTLPQVIQEATQPGSQL